jgi:hypothetical protein
VIYKPPSAETWTGFFGFNLNTKQGPCLHEKGPQSGKVKRSQGFFQPDSAPHAYVNGSLWLNWLCLILQRRRHLPILPSPFWHCSMPSVSYSWKHSRSSSVSVDVTSSSECSEGRFPLWLLLSSWFQTYYTTDKTWVWHAAASLTPHSGGLNKCLSGVLHPSDPSSGTDLSLVLNFAPPPKKICILNKCPDI